MTDQDEQIAVAGEAPAVRNLERREFFRTALGAAAITAVGAAAVTVSAIASAETVSDSDEFNFMLNLEYLLAQFYGQAANGTGLSSSQLTGDGTAGTATGGRQVSFSDSSVSAIAKEMARDTAAHVTFLRTAAGVDAIAQPDIDIDVTSSGAFSTAMRAAGLVGSGVAFDAYADDTNFLLAAFLLQDVVVTAYRSAAASISNSPTNLESFVGLLGTAAYHSAAIRTLLYAKGATTASLRTSADAISNMRDLLDGATTDYDQGISPTTVNGQQLSNITPAGDDGLPFSRSFSSVLNIFYLNSLAVSKGGFFPSGVNGATVTSTAN